MVYFGDLGHSFFKACLLKKNINIYMVSVSQTLMDMFFCLQRMITFSHQVTSQGWWLQTTVVISNIYLIEHDLIGVYTI